MRLRDTTLLSLTALALASAPAWADEPAAAAPLTPPSFPTLGADGLGSSVHAQVGLLTAAEPDEPLWGFELGGQLLGATGWGGYGVLRAATVEDETALAGPELGVLYRTPAASAATTFRAGVAFGGGDSLAPYLDTLARRPSDAIVAFPEMVSLRFAAAPSLRAGNVFLRADLGVDVPVLGEHDTDFVLAHVDGGVGIRTGAVGFVAELQNVIYVGDGDPDPLHTMAFSSEYVSDRTTVSFTLSRAFASELADDLDAIGFHLGVRAAL